MIEGQENEFRRGLPAEPLRTVWPEWERRWNPDGIRRGTWRCRFDGAMYQPEGGEAFSIDEIKIWEDMEFRPYGKTWAEVEDLAAQPADQELQLTQCNGEKIPLSRLDVGIREVVRRLVTAGFDTYDSGDGRSKPEEERWEEVPHVRMRIAPKDMVNETDRLKTLIDSWPLRDLAPPANLPPELMDKPARERIDIVAAYAPGREFVELTLYFVEDAMLADLDMGQDAAAMARVNEMLPWLRTLKAGDVVRLVGWGERLAFATVLSAELGPDSIPVIKTAPDAAMHQIEPLRSEDQAATEAQMEAVIDRLRGANLAMRARVAAYIAFGLDEWDQRLQTKDQPGDAPR